jgi:hypothetical protein
LINYVGLTGAPCYLAPPADPNANTFNSNSKYSMLDVTNDDGASTTLMSGESLGCTDPGGRDHAYSWMGVRSIPTGGGLPDNGGVFNFSSRHPVMVQVCYFDGSVRPFAGLVSGSASCRLRSARGSAASIGPSSGPSRRRGPESQDHTSRVRTRYPRSECRGTPSGGVNRGGG